MNKEIPFAVLFDMDGTLLQTEKLAVPAFQQTFAHLKKEGLWNGPTPDENQLTNVLGMTLTALWEKLLPGTSDETRLLADELMLKYELDLLREDVTDLYPGVRETLAALREEGIALFTASNGLEDYIQEICDHYGITSMFTDLYSAGRFQTKSKVDLVAKLIKDYNIQNAVMVGDRRSDVEAGMANRLFTIGCDFGFAKEGELDGADVLIRQFNQVLDVLPASFQQKLQSKK